MSWRRDLVVTDIRERKDWRSSPRDRLWTRDKARGSLLGVECELETRFRALFSRANASLKKGPRLSPHERMRAREKARGFLLRGECELGARLEALSSGRVSQLVLRVCCTLRVLLVQRDTHRNLEEWWDSDHYTYTTNGLHRKFDIYMLVSN